MKKKATTAAADTSTEVAKMIKDNFRKKVSVKCGTNVEFHSNRMFSEFRIQIEYEYSVAPNSIRILNGVEMPCRDMASSHGQVRAGVIGIVDT